MLDTALTSSASPNVKAAIANKVREVTNAIN